METDAFTVQNGAPADHGSGLTLSMDEARALNSWLLKPLADGSSPLEDEALKPALLRLREHLDYADGVSQVREELEQAGLASERLTDEQVAELGRRIADAPLRRGPAAA